MLSTLKPPPRPLLEWLLATDGFLDKLNADDANDVTELVADGLRECPPPPTRSGRARDDIEDEVDRTVLRLLLIDPLELPSARLRLLSSLLSCFLRSACDGR